MKRATSLVTALVLGLVIVIATGVPTRATEPICPTGDPATDWQNIQDALDTGGEVILQNGPSGEGFELTGIEQSLKITRDVILKGQNDAAGNKTKIIANNNEQVAVYINNPGGRVEFENLHIESNVERIIHVGAIWAAPWNACKDLMIKNCVIVGTHPEVACIGTFGGVTGTVYLEGNHIAGNWCAGDWVRWIGPMSNCRWEVYSNTLVATHLCLDTIASKGIKMENNRCEGPSILHCPATQGEIIVKNNTMIQSGHQVFAGTYSAFVMFGSHQPGFSGGQISGNTIEMNPSEGVPISLAPVMCLADFTGLPDWPGGGVHGVLVQDNTITGKADFGIALANGASDNVIKGNNLENLTTVQFGMYGTAQILIGNGCDNNLFRGNVIGLLGPGAGSGIYCEGDNNDFIRNDYTRSGIPGLTAGGIPCVMLANTYNPTTGDLVTEPENNLVFESDGFPAGTTAIDQVLDQPRDLGTTTNIVVGH